MRPVKLSDLGVKVPSRTLKSPGGGAEIAREMRKSSALHAVPAPYALPVGFAMFLAVGTVAAGLHGRLPATGVLIACAAVAGGDVVRGRADRVGPAGRHRLAHHGRILPAALRAAAADRAGRRPCGHRHRRERAGRRRSRPGVPLVRPTAHTGKHGYEYGHASAPPVPEALEAPKPPKGPLRRARRRRVPSRRVGRRAWPTWWA